MHCVAINNSQGLKKLVWAKLEGVIWKAALYPINVGKYFLIIFNRGHHGGWPKDRRWDIKFAF